MKTKYCKKCGQEKSLKYFFKVKEKKVDLENICKECFVRENYQGMFNTIMSNNWE